MYSKLLWFFWLYTQKQYNKIIWVVLFLSFWGTFHADCHSDYINLHSHQQCIKGSCKSSCVLTIICCYFFSFLAALGFEFRASCLQAKGSYHFLTGVRKTLKVALTYISLMNKDVEHVFMYLLHVCISSFEKCLFSSFAHLLVG
jgi:hypothetical protein